MQQERDILYSFRRCPYAMRARMALQLSEHPCELREVVLRDKPPSLGQISAKATVPVLLTRDKRVIDESLEIMRWTLATRDPVGWLDPAEGELDDVLALIARCDGDFKVHLDGYKYAHGNPAAAEEHRAQASVFLLELDHRLQSRDWLFGARSSLADAAIAPFVRQFANSDRAWFDGQDWQALRAWLDDFLRSPLLASVMHKYAPWQEGTPGSLFPSEAECRWQRRPA